MSIPRDDNAWVHPAALDEAAFHNVPSKSNIKLFFVSRTIVAMAPWRKYNSVDDQMFEENIIKKDYLIFIFFSTSN